MAQARSTTAKKTAATKGKQAKQMLEIGGKEYEFNAAPSAILLRSQLLGKADGITNIDGVKWVLRSLSEADAAEVVSRMESGELDFLEVAGDVVPKAMELDAARRPTS